MLSFILLYCYLPQRIYTSVYRTVAEFCHSPTNCVFVTKDPQFAYFSFDKQSIKLCEIYSRNAIQECLILMTLMLGAFCISSQTPSWVTSSYFRGARSVSNTNLKYKNRLNYQRNLNSRRQRNKSNLTGNSSTPPFTFTYSSAFTSTPQIAYGIKRYNGNDKLRGEAFRINRLTADQTSFSGQVQIIGFTNVLSLAVAYIAIDPAFPHHLNSFDNVPLNYTGGLNNIDSATSSTRSHTQVIDYSAQAAGKPFNTFSTPVTNNKVLMFLTTIYLFASTTVRTALFSSNNFYPMFIKHFLLTQLLHRWYQWCISYLKQVQACYTIFKHCSLIVIINVSLSEAIISLVLVISFEYEYLSFWYNINANFTIISQNN